MKVPMSLSTASTVSMALRRPSHLRLDQKPSLSSIKRLEKMATHAYHDHIMHTIHVEPTSFSCFLAPELSPSHRISPLHPPGILLVHVREPAPTTVPPSFSAQAGRSSSRGPLAATVTCRASPGCGAASTGSHGMGMRPRAAAPPPEGCRRTWAPSGVTSCTTWAHGPRGAASDRVGAFRQGKPAPKRRLKARELRFVKRFRSKTK